MNISRKRVSELVADPANVRRHPQRNLDAIKASLARFGQQKPIVIDAEGIVRAGNGTLAAAIALGWEEIDVVVTPLEGIEATAFAIADNRTAELADWDDAALAEQLKAISVDDKALAEACGFDEKELADAAKVLPQAGSEYFIETDGCDGLKAPFPYFGGKRKVAATVWRALGQPAHYIEPFFGSGAVLLARPDYDANEHTETVNDKDGFICNVWRALKADPDGVAEWCDWPVNHADLNARRKRLIANEERLLENLVADDEWFDAKLAGYWVWAASCWIGGGLTCPNAIPHVGSAGKGVHAPTATPIHNWFRSLQHRLRRVRVVCGDWTRVCGGNWQNNMGDVGIFFDPPYGVEDRETSVYHHDSTSIAADVMKWCLERGSRPSYRIVLAGYDEYEELANYGWSKIRWRAGGGYGNLGDGQGKNNRHRETLWLSPHCLNPLPQSGT